MENFRRYNLILGWGVFLVSLIVYLLTMEPTASFWDCGEFIATAYKMEVGHPPGAPFFMVLGRFFTLFAGGDVTKVAVTMNILSATASAFTILFLFWTLTHLVRKFFSQEDQQGPVTMITIFGAALVGSWLIPFQTLSGFQLLRLKFIPLLPSLPPWYSGPYLNGKMWLMSPVPTAG